MVSVVATFTGTLNAGSSTQASQPGDIFICMALRNGSTTPPSLASGWFALNTNFSTGGTTRGIRWGFKRANAVTNQTDISTTWTNSNILLCIQLRPDSGKGIALGTLLGATNIGNSTTPTYGALTLIGGASDKYVLSMAANTSLSDMDSVTPTSSTAIDDYNDGANELAAFLSSAVGSWSNSTPTISPSSPWATYCVEVYEFGSIQYWDDFDRSNMDLGTSTATGTNGGWNWAHTGGAPSAATIASNKLQANTVVGDGYYFATPDIGIRDQYVEWTIEATGANSAFFDLRFTDSNNKVSVRQNSSDINVFRRVSSTYTNVATVAASPAAGDVFRVEVREDNFQIFKNGVSLSGPTAIGAIMNGTKSGLNPRSATYTDWARDIKFGTTVTAGSSSQNLSVGFLNDGNTLYAPTLAPQSVTGTPGHLANANTLYSPTLVATATLTPALLDAGNTLYAPTLVPGSITAQPGLLTNTSTLYAPTISNLAGEQTALPSLLTNTSELYTPTLVNMLQTLEVPFLGSGTEVFSPIIYDTLFPPSSQRGGFMPSGGRGAHGRFAYIVVEEERKILKAAKSLLKSRKPKRKKRKELAKLIAEEVEERAEAKGHVDIPQRPIYEAALAELEAFTDIVNAEWTMLRPEVIEAIQSAEETATRLVEERLAEEDDDEFYRLMTM